MTPDKSDWWTPHLIDKSCDSPRIFGGGAIYSSTYSYLDFLFQGSLISLYSPPQNTMWNSPKVGILGGGQLGRMLVEAANRLNIQTNVLDADNSPAKQISSHDGHVTGSFKEPDAVRQLAKSCDVITAEIEHVDTYALEEVAKDVRVEPSWQAIRTIQNKFNQKEHLRKYGIPMAKHAELVQNTPEELARIGEELGYPLMLKSKTMAYDGRGKVDNTSAMETRS